MQYDLVVYQFYLIACGGEGRVGSLGLAEASTGLFSVSVSLLNTDCLNSVSSCWSFQYILQILLLVLSFFGMHWAKC